MDIWKVLGTLCVAVLAVVVFNVLRYAFRRRALSLRLPGKKTAFIDVMGNAGDFPIKASSRNGFSFLVFMLQIWSAYAALFRGEGVFCFWVSYVPFNIVIKAEGVEALIGSSKHTRKSWLYSLLHPWLGTGLLTSHGSKWKSRRKLLTPSFHFDILKDFLIVFNEQSQILAECLRKEITNDFTDIIGPITLCSLDIICETTLGTSIRAQENKELQYVQSLKIVRDIIMERSFNSLDWPEFIFSLRDKGKDFKKHVNILHDFTRSVIREKKSKLLSGDDEIDKRKRKALMDLLLHHHIRNGTLTEEDIREEVDTFLFEGHDTIAMALCWALYLIGLYKDVQEKVHVELDRIFGDDVNRLATTEDLKDMEYLERVIKESQRLFPSVPMIARQTSEDVNICGYTIPKGEICAVLIYQLHRDESVFPNAEKFDPDRFLPENSANRHPFAYIPFSAGPRNCIGQRFAMMEEKVVLSSLLRNFSVESLDQRDTILPTADIVLTPSKPLRVRIRQRRLNRP